MGRFCCIFSFVVTRMYPLSTLYPRSAPRMRFRTASIETRLTFRSTTRVDRSMPPAPMSGSTTMLRPRWTSAIYFRTLSRLVRSKSRSISSARRRRVSATAFGSAVTAFVNSRRNSVSSFHDFALGYRRYVSSPLTRSPGRTADSSVSVRASTAPFSRVVRV